MSPEKSLRRLTPPFVLATVLLALATIEAKPVNKFCEDKDPGLYPDPENCRLYYSCDHGLTYSMPCPAGLIFDPQWSVCNWKYAVSEERKRECQQLSQATASSSSTRPPTISTSTRKPSPLDKLKDTLINPRMPKAMQMRFKMGDLPMAVDVEQIPGSAADTNPKVITAFRGRISEWKTNETFAIYSNKDKTASFVASTAGKKDSYDFTGNFMMNGTQYFMKKKKAFNMSPATSKDKKVNYNGEHYVISTEDDHSFNCPTAKQRPSRSKRSTSNDTAPTFVGAVPAAAAASTAGTKQRYGVELFLAIDYATYYKFLLQSNKSTNQEKQADAINSIRYYFAHIINGVNSRYLSINQTDFEIYIRLVGYFIAMTVSDSPWTEGYGIKFDRYYTDANYSLYEFGYWLDRNAASLMRYDVAILVTSNLLFNGYYSDNTKRVISGLAWIGAACRKPSTGVCYEFGEYSSIETIAHEAGHILGAWHDSLQINSCDYAQQYIMASAPTALTNATFNNPFTFSSCSVNYFRSYINQLDRENANCLLNEASNVEPSDTENFLRVYPGQKYRPDAQCQLVYGQNSFYCAGGGRDQSICYSMPCWSPDDGICYAATEQRAYDGTTCANGSWCYMGRCVRDDMAPAAPLSCIYGDYRGSFTIDNQKYTCPQIGVYKPYLCYDISYSGECCTTCNATKDVTKPGCEYGDREPDWCRNSLLPYHCYDATVRSRCCSTCSRYYRGVTGCEYGDRADWCSQVTAEQCYQSAGTCCSSCARFYTGIPGCEYGDKNTGCPQYASSCQSNPDIANLCCRTCYTGSPNTSPARTTIFPSTSTPRITALPSTATTPPPAVTQATTAAVSTPDSPQCSLGDRDPSCSSLNGWDCYYSGYQSSCCKTCSKYYNATRTGCEYGDQVPWCSTYVQGVAECLRPEVKQYCCDTCTKYLGGCMQGDKAEWCSSYVTGPRQCTDPNVQENCCETCLKYQTGVLQPQCLDKADYCSTLLSGHCYDDATRDTCCLTCKSFYRNQPKCEYGDMLWWCAAQYCDQNPVECCETCK